MENSQEKQFSQWRITKITHCYEESAASTDFQAVSVSDRQTKVYFRVPLNDTMPYIEAYYQMRPVSWADIERDALKVLESL